MQHIHAALLRALDLLGMGDCVNPKDRLNHLAERLEGEAGEELAPAFNGRVDQPKGFNDARLSLVGGFDGRHGEDGEAAKNSAVYALDLALQRDHSAQCVATYADFEKLAARLVQLRCVDAWLAWQMRKAPKVRRKAVFPHLRPLLGLGIDDAKQPLDAAGLWLELTASETLNLNLSAVRWVLAPSANAALVDLQCRSDCGLRSEMGDDI